MQAHRKGFDLKIQIALALHSLGRPHKGVTKRLTLAELDAMLKGLRHEQRERGILKVHFVRVE